MRGMHTLMVLENRVLIEYFDLMWGGGGSDRGGGGKM